MMHDALFDVAGPPDARAIVLVHGSVVTRAMWLPQLRGLSDTYRVIAPDLPGHGVLAAEPFTFANAAAHLARLMAAEIPAPAIVVGASLGGYVALDLARQQPERVAGLVLAGASRNFTGAIGVYLRLAGGVLRRGWLMPSRDRLEARVRRMFPPALAEGADAQLRAGLYPASLGAAFGEMAGRDFQSLLADFPGHTLILNGEQDTGNRRAARRFARSSRRGTVAVIGGAGHACNLDRPDAFNAAVRDFAAAVFEGS